MMLSRKRHHQHNVYNSTITATITFQSVFLFFSLCISLFSGFLHFDGSNTFPTAAPVAITLYHHHTITILVVVVVFILSNQSLFNTLLCVLNVAWCYYVPCTILKYTFSSIFAFYIIFLRPSRTLLRSTLLA